MITLYISPAKKEQSSVMKHIILLYYKYVNIQDPQALMRDQKVLCNRLHLKGRIIIAHEGINGTVSGSPEATDAYIEALHAIPEFADVEFKLGDDTESAFPKMSIKVRDEIVSLKAAEAIDMQNTGTYLEPDEMFEMLKTEKDLVIIDARNN